FTGGAGSLDPHDPGGGGRPGCGGLIGRKRPRAVADPSASAYLLRMDAILAPDIILTPSAAARVATIAAKQGKPAILRLSVDG
ncbi:hypothetical protein, partial [Salmonella enterica]|uniref:hypothetical protein n=1 Tax=Salmonella enterica TaxID=28901 RepID=UPI0032B68596